MKSPLLDAMQWPAMAVTLLSVWLVASSSEKRRRWGFWASLVSNVLWTVWGVSSSAYAVIGLQIGLAGLNIRGIRKNQRG